MDLISDVMAVLRTGRPFAGRFAQVAPWSDHRRGRPNGFGVQVMVRGSAVATAADGKSFTLDPGDVLLVPHGSPHLVADSPLTPPGPPCDESAEFAGAVIRSDNPEATHVMLCMAYELAPNRAHPLIATLPDFVHVKADPAERPELAQAVAMLDGELAEELRGGDTLVPALLDAVLMYLLRAIHGARHDQCGFSGWAQALADDSIAASLEAIHADPARQWTVASLGEVAGLSRSAFSRRFTELVGQPPQGYLTSWRLTLAARLLTDTDAPLASVARQVGYASEFAFAAAFKREFSSPPGQFRKLNPACDTGSGAPAGGPEPFRRLPVPA
ncbi:AraC family transcriptional regulator [Glycomyces harbinensis]|uniref:AraC-type DNA-binding protein n=1 Tax=Glycomyces harbinensis TaxID=58114 RepID=A0A1G7DKQ9_9ACTN|nr:AraC family transcriptional regulator [Glycomyces harbinensis]SDE52108.1 AraC-type DNA-binding protein [Glycomyces harbinensis]